MPQLTTIQLFAVWILPVLFAITAHEAAHGWVANKLGDKTALMLGRLTFNPLKHIDPMGTIVVPALLFFTSSMLGKPFIFGWAKPVPINYFSLGKPKRDMAFVALAGPLANLVMAFGWALIIKIGLYLSAMRYEWALAIVYMGQAGIMINCVLLALNILPLPPLDGSRVVSSLLPNAWAEKYNRLEPMGFFILLGLLVLGILPLILQPIVFILQNLIVTIFKL